MSDQYVLVDRDGDVAGYWFTDEKAAWAEAEVRMSATKHFGPYTVARLVPVPRPVPPRPTAVIDGTKCHVLDGTLRWPDRTRKTLTAIDDMREAIALYDATEQWEKDRGGQQP
jgi:hypothetical protein